MTASTQSRPVRIIKGTEGKTWEWAQHGYTEKWKGSDGRWRYRFPGDPAPGSKPLGTGGQRNEGERRPRGRPRKDAAEAIQPSDTFTMDDRVRDIASAVLDSVPIDVLQQMNQGSFAQQMDHLKAHVPAVYDELKGKFDAMGIKPSDAQSFLHKSLQRKGWSPAARGALVGVVNKIRPEHGFGLSDMPQLVQYAEHLASKRGGPVLSQDIADAVAWRFPSGKMYSDAGAKTASAGRTPGVVQSIGQANNGRAPESSFDRMSAMAEAGHLITPPGAAGSAGALTAGPTDAAPEKRGRGRPKKDRTPELMAAVQAKGGSPAEHFRNIASRLEGGESIESVLKEYQRPEPKVREPKVPVERTPEQKAVEMADDTFRKRVSNTKKSLEKYHNNPGHFAAAYDTYLNAHADHAAKMKELGGSSVRPVMQAQDFGIDEKVFQSKLEEGRKINKARVQMHQKLHGHGETPTPSPPKQNMTVVDKPAADVVDKPASTPKESLAQAMDHAYHMDGFRDIFIPKKMKGLSPAALEETLRQAKVSPEGIAKVAAAPAADKLRTATDVFNQEQRAAAQQVEKLQEQATKQPVEKLQEQEASESPDLTEKGDPPSSQKDAGTAAPPWSDKDGKRYADLLRKKRKGDLGEMSLESSELEKLQERRVAYNTREAAEAQRVEVAAAEARRLYGGRSKEQLSNAATQFKTNEHPDAVKAKGAYRAALEDIAQGGHPPEAAAALKKKAYGQFVKAAAAHYGEHGWPGEPATTAAPAPADKPATTATAAPADKPATTATAAPADKTSAQYPVGDVSTYSPDAGKRLQQAFSEAEDGVEQEALLAVGKFLGGKIDSAKLRREIEAQVSLLHDPEDQADVRQRIRNLLLEIHPSKMPATTQAQPTSSSKPAIARRRRTEK